MIDSSETSSFSIRVHGKWIVAGEHSVLRGSPALAFPVYGKYLELNWRMADRFSSSFGDERGHEFQILFSGVFDRALEILGREGDKSLRTGDFEVNSTLPVGSGLGASAALSVAVGRWFVFRQALKENALFEFCRELENLFHGESSGVDVAVALEARGLHFERFANQMRAFDPVWQPYWYISYSGARAITSECVASVKAFIAENPIQGKQIDQNMARAVALAEHALCDSQSHHDARLGALAEAIEIAGQCFSQWGLARGEMARHLDWLKGHGALAVKPTGSGGGGYALSLWRERPALEIEKHLIAVYRS